MYFPDPRRNNHVFVLLFLVSLTFSQDTDFQTIYSLTIFSSQKPCAQSCFVYGSAAPCLDDYLGNAIGCVSGQECQGARDGAPNSCYCRADLQSVAESYLTSCVSNACAVGNSSIDISSAVSIYEYYCSSKGFPAAVVATTTTPAGVQATTTVYVTVYRSSGLSTRQLAFYAMIWNIWGLCFFLVYISKILCVLNYFPLIMLHCFFLVSWS